ncbi:proteinase inhibitor [Rhodanobacter sp. C01]|nr:proteinase inhibitor [Rhodanobacter sp. C01]
MHSHSKPAGIRCVQLTDDNLCTIFGDPRCLAVCASLQAEPVMCSSDRAHALAWLMLLEVATSCA